VSEPPTPGAVPDHDQLDDTFGARGPVDGVDALEAVGSTDPESPHSPWFEQQFGGQDADPVPPSFDPRYEPGYDPGPGSGQQQFVPPAQPGYDAGYGHAQAGYDPRFEPGFDPSYGNGHYSRPNSPPPVYMTPDPSAPYRNGPLDGLRKGPLPLIGAVVALLAAAGLIGWMFSGSGGDQEITIGGSETEGQGATSDGQAPAEDLPPLSPATLPATNEDGVVGLELALIDPYTGTGSTGSVELYLNSITGEVCHTFEVPSLTGRYQAYVHEAVYPREGPIVVDLGEVANGVPRCVNASPIDVTRALLGSEGFYVAAHGPNREVVLRGQISQATPVFDNRDPELLASQEAARAAAENAAGDGLFGPDNEGAYLVVDAGRVSFEGAVPDQATAEQLRSTFIALSGMGVEVVDNLEVRSGAPAPSGRVLVADALLFGIGEDRISGDSPVLETLADLMIVNPAWTMTITGHTDNMGDYLLNVELSLRRANNVRERLAQLDVPPERIRVQGAGPDQPIESNDTEEGRARNRRIEVSIDS
jgi:OOP family OmpA-OmpF porin